MQVISISEVVSLLRQRRNGRKFIVEFLNQCEWIDAIPLTEIEKAREEIQGNYEGGNHADEFSDGYGVAINDCLAILDKLIAESEG